ncbi:MAG: glycoside hydrolase family 127 protein [Pirellulales bacterium]|nr:glycoside hydrolase family 127 protein [Pirellulales bacterium]
MNIFSKLAVLIILSNVAIAADNSEKISAVDQLIPIDMREVKVAGEIGRRTDNTIYKNLLKLDIDKDFLPPFRAKATEKGYIGLGKTVDAAVRFAIYSKDPRVLALKKHIVDEVINTQTPDGYIGTLIPKNRVWGTYDIHEMSYMALGLTNDYKYFGEKASLASARKLLDFIIARWSAEPDRIPGLDGTRARMYGVTTGLEAALLTMYEQTKDRKYLDFCTNSKHCKLPGWNAEKKIGWLECMDDERHVYIHICLCVAQMQLNHITPDPKLSRQARGVIDYLTRHDGLLASGSCSFKEGWDNTQQLAGMVSESCVTAYLIRMLDRLLWLEGDSKYGDMMERAVYNALFAAQAPDGRKLRYFTPLEGKRVYFGTDTFCCPNNFRRIMAELPEMIYYRRDGGLAINLYTQSKAQFDLGDGLSLAVRQETDYPTSGKVTIYIDPSKTAKFPLLLRIPRWTGKAATVAVNGQSVKQNIPSGSFFTIDRQWKPGDRVELNMPMQWRFIKGRKKQAGLAALMRGPQLFCISRAKNKVLEKADLRQVIIDPSSLGSPIKDDTIRPNGLKCIARAWSPGKNQQQPPDLAIVLTEFADPGGEATYFRLPDLGVAVDDELINTGLAK